MTKERIREILIIIFLLLLILVPATLLFFAEGGQIYGINYDPNTMKNPYETSELVMVPIEEELVPIYDGTEIIPIELWQLPPRDILISLITYPMAYIPPTTSKLIGIIYLLSGLAFIILYRRRDIKRNLEPDAKPEKILSFIKENPGSSMQQISIALNIPRGTLRHYLLRLSDKQKISIQNYHGNPAYYPVGTYSSFERTLLAVYAREKDHKFFTLLLEHPNLTRSELAEFMNLTPVTMRWYIKRFTEEHLLEESSFEKEKLYRISNNAEECWTTLFPKEISRLTTPFGGEKEVSKT